MTQGVSFVWEAERGRPSRPPAADHTNFLRRIAPRSSLLQCHRHLRGQQMSKASRAVGGGGRGDRQSNQGMAEIQKGVLEVARIVSEQRLRTGCTRRMLQHQPEARAKTRRGRPPRLWRAHHCGPRRARRLRRDITEGRCPSQTKSARTGLMHSTDGVATIDRVYTDKSGERTAAIRDSPWRRDVSTPQGPQTKGVAEQAVRRTLEGSRPPLLQSGLPLAVWCDAAHAFCAPRYVSDKVDGRRTPNALPQAWSLLQRISSCFRHSHRIQARIAEGENGIKKLASSHHARDLRRRQFALGRIVERRLPHLPRRVVAISESLASCPFASESRDRPAHRAEVCQLGRE